MFASQPTHQYPCFYETRGGCKNGDACPFLHRSAIPCYWQSHGGCTKGDLCLYLHTDLVAATDEDTSRALETQPQTSAIVTTPSPSTDTKPTPTEDAPTPFQHQLQQLTAAAPQPRPPPVQQLQEQAVSTSTPTLKLRPLPVHQQQTQTPATSVMNRLGRQISPPATTVPTTMNASIKVEPARPTQPDAKPPAPKIVSLAGKKVITLVATSTPAPAPAPTSPAKKSALQPVSTLSDLKQGKQPQTQIQTQPQPQRRTSPPVLAPQNSSSQGNALEKVKIKTLDEILKEKKAAKEAEEVARAAAAAAGGGAGTGTEVKTQTQPLGRKIQRGSVNANMAMASSASPPAPALTLTDTNTNTSTTATIAANTPNSAPANSAMLRRVGANKTVDSAQVGSMGQAATVVGTGNISAVARTNAGSNIGAGTAVLAATAKQQQKQQGVVNPNPNLNQKRPVEHAQAQPQVPTAAAQRDLAKKQPADALQNQNQSPNQIQATNKTVVTPTTTTTSPAVVGITRRASTPTQPLVTKQFSSTPTTAPIQVQTQTQANTTPGKRTLEATAAEGANKRLKAEERPAGVVVTQAQNPNQNQDVKQPIGATVTTPSPVVPAPTASVPTTNPVLTVADRVLEKLGSADELDLEEDFEDFGELGDEELGDIDMDELL